MLLHNLVQLVLGLQAVDEGDLLGLVLLVMGLVDDLLQVLATLLLCPLHLALQQVPLLGQQTLLVLSHLFDLGTGRWVSSITEVRTSVSVLPLHYFIVTNKIFSRTV